MYQTICQVKPLKFIIKLYINHDTLLLKHATYQKAESLRATSLSKLNNTLNNNSIFNTKCAELSTTWQVLFQFHNPTCSYNHTYNLHQKFSLANFQCLIPSLLQKSFLQSQSPLTLSSSLPQQFLNSLFLRVAILAMYIKSIFPTSAIQPIQIA